MKTRVTTSVPASTPTIVSTGNTSSATSTIKTVYVREYRTVPSPLTTASYVTKDDLATGLLVLRTETNDSLHALEARLRSTTNTNTSSHYGGGSTNTTGTFTQLTSDRLSLGRLTVTGTATSTIAGDTAFDTNTLYVDSINHRVGIGTSSPSDTFALTGSAYLAPISVPSVTANRLYNINNDLYWAGSVIGGATTGQWTTDGTNVWRAGGNVGVGTTSPQANLGLAGSIGVNATQLVLTADGNVNVGTANSIRTFQVAASGPAANATNPYIADFRNNTTTSGANPLYTLSVSRQNSDTGALYVGADGNADAIIAANNANLRIGKDLAGTFSEYIRINTSGNVGIGTTSPQAKFAVTGSGTGTGRLFALANSSNAEKLTVLDNGNVGIGTASADAKFAVSGTGSGGKFGIIGSGFISGENEGSYPSFGYNIAGQGAGATQFAYSVSDFASWIKFDTGKIVFNVAPSGTPGNTISPITAMTILNTGNVGIGTASPMALLALSGSFTGADRNMLQITNTSSTNTQSTSLTVTSNDTSTTLSTYGTGYTAVTGYGGFSSLNNAGTNGGLILSASGTNGVIRFATGSLADTNERVRIDKTGNVGIGTTTPYAKLSVAGGTSGVLIGADALSGYTGNLLDLKVASTTVFSVNQGGAITNSATSTATYFAASTLGSVGSPAFTFSSDTDTGMWSPSANTLAYSTGGSERVRIDSSGNVGVGTSSPTSALDINGTLNIKGKNGLFIDQLNWNLAIGDTAFPIVVDNSGGGRVSMAVGQDALKANTTGYENMAIGIQALYANTTGNVNVAVGVQSLYSNTTGSGNTGLGIGASVFNTTGSRNVAVGLQALQNVTTGSNNTAIGWRAGQNVLVTGSNNILIGGGTGDASGLVETPASDTSNFLNIGNTIYSTMNNGRVAISTTSPYAKFSVAGGTSGVLIGADALSGYTGNLLDLKVASTTVFSVNQGGAITNSATSTATYFAASTLGSVGSPAFTFSSDTDTGMWSPTANTLAYSTGGSERMRIDSSGNVGIGTTSPSALFSVAGSGFFGGTAPAVNVYTTNTSGPALVLTGGGTFDGRNWQIISGGSNNIDSGSTGKLLFYDATAGSRRMVIDTSGNVGIGTTTPWRTLSVVGTVGLSSTLGTGVGGNYLCIDTTTFEVLRGNGSACTASSLRFKENVKDLQYGLADVLKLRPVSFTYKPETNMGDGTKLGFIAEEVNSILPEVITKDKEGNVFGLDYPVLTSVLTKAVQELNAKTTSFINSLAELVKTKEVQTDKLCIGQTCVTETELKALLQTHTASPLSTSTTATTPEATSTPTSSSTPESTSTATATATSATPESTPEATSTPVSEPPAPTESTSNTVP